MPHGITLFECNLICTSDKAYSPVQASGGVKTGFAYSQQAVQRAAMVPASIVGRCLCTAQAAAGHLAHRLRSPQAKDALETALGLCLMGFVAAKALRLAR